MQVTHMKEMLVGRAMTWTGEHGVHAKRSGPNQKQAETHPLPNGGKNFRTRSGFGNADADQGGQLPHRCMSDWQNPLAVQVLAGSGDRPVPHTAAAARTINNNVLERIAAGANA